MVMVTARPSIRLRRLPFIVGLIGLLLLLPCDCASSSAEEALSSDENVVFDNLAKQIVAEGGYVHPSLQLATPAPCGAKRGVILSKLTVDGDRVADGIWLRVPFAYQLTRDLALETLTPLIPAHVLDDAPLATLDDAALLVLLLVHLMGKTGESDRWHPYLASLPKNDLGCGWWGDAATGAKGMEYQGVVPRDAVLSSRKYVSRVSNGMARDYGLYLSHEHWPRDWKDGYDSSSNDDDGLIQAAARVIQWSLCILSSRGTAASSALGGGSVRLVPMADLFNHDVNSFGFIESTEQNAGSGELMGAFEVKRKEQVVPGDEITVDYNLVDFTPEEWFLSHGFVPQEALAPHNVGRSEF
ncbi:hypothetical protein ACHAWF_015648 [Thalassiosira exigua]